MIIRKLTGPRIAASAALAKEESPGGPQLSLFRVHHRAVARRHRRTDQALERARGFARTRSSAAEQPTLRRLSLRECRRGSVFSLQPRTRPALCPPSVDPSRHAPAAVVNRMARDGAICREVGLRVRASAARSRTPARPEPADDAGPSSRPRMRARCRCSCTRTPDRRRSSPPKAGVDVIAHGMWNGHDSAKGKLGGRRRADPAGVSGGEEPATSRHRRSSGDSAPAGRRLLRGPVCWRVSIPVS